MPRSLCAELEPRSSVPSPAAHVPQAASNPAWPHRAACPQPQPAHPQRGFAAGRALPSEPGGCRLHPGHHEVLWVLRPKTRENRLRLPVFPHAPARRTAPPRSPGFVTASRRGNRGLGRRRACVRPAHGAGREQRVCSGPPPPRTHRGPERPAPCAAEPSERRWDSCGLPRPTRARLLSVFGHCGFSDQIFYFKPQFPRGGPQSTYCFPSV